MIIWYINVFRKIASCPPKKHIFATQKASPTKRNLRPLILPQVSVDFQLIDPPINTSNPPMNLLQSGGEMDTVASTGTEALGDLDLHARNEQGATNPEQGEGDLGPDEQGAEISEQGANQSPRGNRMRKRFNLEEGKVKCRCLIRRWRFCPHIKSLADN